MTTFLIKHAMSVNGKLLNPETRYQTDDASEIEDLRKRAGYEACVEMKSATPQEKKEAREDADAGDDLTAVHGIGAKTLEKLAEAGITTKTQLKEKIQSGDKEVKDILGANYDKVSKFVA